MPVIQERIKPTVHVRCAEDAPQEVLRQLQYGMEEEGIPWEAAAGTIPFYPNSSWALDRLFHCLMNDLFYCKSLFLSIPVS